jgi:uncharacterized protein with ParB-like and HNH nuclease domain
MTPSESNDWFDDYAANDDELQVVEYDITASPNDFNVSTLFSFIESGAVIIPGFQRHFVWDIKRSSKLIESLILGLPVPQIFLYEESRNRFLVIDGQQRLMSIYYFIKQRFPRQEARTDLRRVFEEYGRIPDEILHNDKYFSNFRLQLPAKLPDVPNRFADLSYATLGDYKIQFDLRPIRNVIVKQNVPKDDDSSIYEIFSRLNSGGVNLTPQEIRLSLYHSSFYDMLVQANTDDRWRHILNSTNPDLHLKDVEILLRMFAMLIDSASYAPSMTRFLNQFSRKAQGHDEDKNAYLKALFHGFLDATTNLPPDAFLNKRNRRLNIALIEAVFVAACEQAFGERRVPEGRLEQAAIEALETDAQFVQAAARGTTQTGNVKLRLERAETLIPAL